MIDTADHGETTAAAGTLRVLARSLAGLTGGSDAEVVDLLEGLERLKGAAAARQAELTAQLDGARAEQARAAGRRPADAGLGTEIGLARRVSPHRGRACLRLSRALTRDLPQTLELLRAGEISERRAEIVATESRHLTREQRLGVDTELAGGPHPLLPGLGELETLQATRRVALRLDEVGYLERRSRALAERRVTARRLGEGMSAVTVVLPSEVVAAAMTSLRSRAKLQQAAVPDEDRSLTQIQADLAAERLAGTAFGAGGPVAVKVVVSAETLLGEGCEPGLVPGCGHLPASVARALVRRGLAHHSTSAHRVFHFPGTGDLAAMETDHRLFTGLLRDLMVDIRDHGICRTPWCNAPAVHADHPTPARSGGPTTLTNGQSLCEGCNYAKETTGFRHQASRDDEFRHTVEITTPTGHRHRSHAPPLPIPPPPTPPPRPPVDRRSRRDLTLGA